MDKILKKLEELQSNIKELKSDLAEVKKITKENKKDIVYLKEKSYKALTELELQEMKINEIEDNLISHKHKFNFESTGSHKVDMYNLN